MTNAPVSSPSGAARPPAIPHRLEGRDKVRGQARYAGDIAAADVPGGVLDVAVAVTSTQATGRVLTIDAAAALALPGVRLVVTHENAPRLHKVTVLDGAELGDLLPLQDARLHYNGQCLALVVADTLEHARAAAALVEVRYGDPDPAAFTLAQGAERVQDVAKVGGGDPGQVQVGHAEPAYAQAACQVDLTFHTAPHHHNAMEPGAAVAAWDAAGGLTVQLPTQFSYGSALILGQAFGFGLKDRLPGLLAQVLGGFEFDGNVRVVSTLAGGAFGGKTTNQHLLLAAMAAKLNARPVKLVLTRAQTFSLMPFRGETRQRIRLGADVNGQLQAVIQDAVLAKGTAGQFVEPAGEATAKLYACPNIRVHQQAAALDTNAPGWMRCPGVSVGLFALESALDALAYELRLDPLDLRLRNHADTEPDTGKEWSSKSLLACYQAAAARIGWADRNPRVGSMREGGRLVGYGMATAYYPTKQMPAAARITLAPDGRALVQTAAHEIGQGMITVLTQIAAETLGLELAAVRLEWGDTRLPFGGMTVGSMTTLANGAAIREAGELVLKALYKRVKHDKTSPLHGQPASALRVVQGQLVGPGGTSEPVAAIMARHPGQPLSAEAITGRTFGRSKYGRAAFGAQFVKVSVAPDTGDIRVEKLVGAFAGGRVINPVLVRSQLLGGMVWGIGQALMEESLLDPRTGRWLNPNLGEALVPTHADIRDLEALIIEEDDTRGHPLGVKGLGEIGVAGMAAAVANALYHATGQRLTSLPMRLDSLLLLELA